MRISEANRPYRPYGAARDLLVGEHSKKREICLEGPAGTGKSRGCLEKAHICAEKYPGMRGLFIRKTRKSITDTALVTFETKVVPEGHAALKGAQRTNRHSYVYPNGSEIIVSGLDDPTKLMSSEFDLIYVQEAIELTEDDWEKLTTRLRNGMMPYQQLISDTNPDVPTHWLKQRGNAGLTEMLLSRHEDNPRFYDHSLKKYTPEGIEYIETLDRLKGVRYQRFRLGNWVAAEGMVYEMWDAAVHLVNRFTVPDRWRRFWTIDFGFTNPFVWQEWVEDDDGRIFRHKEIYKTRTLIKDHAEMIKREATGKPALVIADHDAEGRAQLERRLGVTIVPAHKAVLEGIQCMAERLETREDGRPRMMFMRDSLVHNKDPHLVDAKLPTCTEEEIPGYIWDTGNGRKQKEAPVKENDHGCDASRYIAAIGRKKSSKRARVGGKTLTITVR